MLIRTLVATCLIGGSLMTVDAQQQGLSAPPGEAVSPENLPSFPGQSGFGEAATPAPSPPGFSVAGPGQRPAPSATTLGVPGTAYAPLGLSIAGSMETTSVRIVTAAAGKEQQRMELYKDLKTFEHLLMNSDGGILIFRAPRSSTPVLNDATPVTCIPEYGVVVRAATRNALTTVTPEPETAGSADAGGVDDAWTRAQKEISRPTDRSAAVTLLGSLSSTGAAPVTPAVINAGVEDAEKAVAGCLLYANRIRHLNADDPVISVILDSAADGSQHSYTIRLSDLEKAENADQLRMNWRHETIRPASRDPRETVRRAGGFFENAQDYPGLNRPPRVLQPVVPGLLAPATLDGGVYPATPLPQPAGPGDNFSAPNSDAPRPR